ncbi:MAG: flagellar basal-body rod protein FlgG [Gammaproteobacteria bacterium]|nr:MAG: flagellar basal-body rod protein FlgG [Gammaproteobacteria bacterium]
MIESLYIGATGLHTHKTQIDLISNNLANVATPGFKKDRVNFQDLLYSNSLATNGVGNTPNAQTRVGYGTAISSAEKVFDLGELKKTDRALDIAIRGKGFFEITLPNGDKAYTKAGVFAIDEFGTLITANGYQVSANVQIPSDATELIVKENGEVLVRVADEVDPISIGSIELADFVNPSALNPLGDNLYAPTEQSGVAYFGDPGESGFGKLAQGFVEVSNVSFVEEMTNLVVAQRAYEINAKLIQAADQILSITNDLRR